ncbi:MAG: hypothetical protein IPL43_13635 [Micropruina sp.]|nr:hypothetical protein [Micropruina sp.]
MDRSFLRDDPSSTATSDSPGDHAAGESQACPEGRAGTATIDGITNDWNWTDPAAATTAIHKTPRARGTIYLMWDVDALYVLARVRDPSLNAPSPLDRSQIYHGDAVILELGAGNRTYAKESLARPTDAYYMFGLGFPIPLIGVMGPNLAGTSFDPPMRDASQITAVMVPAGDGSGYDLEARIPWTATGLNDHAAGSVLAANFLISDRLTDSMKNRGMVSTNPQRTPELRAHPAYWQELQLLP